MIDKVVPDLNRMFGNRDWTWVQDGARPHTSKVALNHLAEVFPHVIPKEDWPPNSPDLSPTEYANGYVHSEVQAKNLPP